MKNSNGNDYGTTDSGGKTLALDVDHNRAKLIIFLNYV